MTKGFRLITEHSDDVEFVTESKDGKEHLYIIGRYIVGEEKNKNGRIYPMVEVLEPAVAKYVKEVVEDGRAYGELGHPSGPAINGPLISHRVTELTRDGNYFNGKAIVVPGTNGNMIRGLLETGGKLGVSTRGMGSLQEKNGGMEVQKDFKLAAIDTVTDPSAPGAFVNGIMEGVEWFFDSAKGTWWKEEIIHGMAKEARQMTKEEREAKALVMFEEYCAMLAVKSLVL
jgi:hypothetical protein